MPHTHTHTHTHRSTLSRVSRPRLILDSPKLPRSHVRVVIDGQALHRHLQNQKTAGPRRATATDTLGLVLQWPRSWPRES